MTEARKAAKGNWDEDFNDNDENENKENPKGDRRKTNYADLSNRENMLFVSSVIM